MTFLTSHWIQWVNTPNWNQSITDSLSAEIRHPDNYILLYHSWNLSMTWMNAWMIERVRTECQKKRQKNAELMNIEFGRWWENKYCIDNEKKLFLFIYIYRRASNQFIGKEKSFFNECSIFSLIMPVGYSFISFFSLF